MKARTTTLYLVLTLVALVAMLLAGCGAAATATPAPAPTEAPAPTAAPVATEAPAAVPTATEAPAATEAPTEAATTAAEPTPTSVVGNVEVKTSGEASGLTGDPEKEAATGKYGKFPGVTVKAAFIGGGTYEQMYEAIPAWEKATGAKVEIVFKGDGFQIDKKLKQDYAAGTVDYDLQWDHTSFFTQYEPFLEPLESYFTADELKDFLPRVVDAARKDGHLWEIPRHADISAYYYRTDLFNDPKNQADFKAKFGWDLKPPETYDQMLQICEFFNKPPDLYCTASVGKEEAVTGRFYEVLTALGGKFIDEKGNVAFNSPEGVKALEYFVTLYQKKYTPPDTPNLVWDGVAKYFQNGNSVIQPDWYGWYGSYNDPKASKVAGKFGMARQPAGPNGVHGGWSGAHAFSIPKDAKNKEAAVSLMKFLTSAEVEYRESRDNGYLAVRNSVWDQMIADASKSSVALDKERWELARQQLSEDMFTPPLIAQWLPISDKLYPQIQAAMVGDKTPQQALDEAAKQGQTLIDEANKQ